jgi:hypothetical protein
VPLYVWIIQHVSEILGTGRVIAVAWMRLGGGGTIHERA